MLNLITPDIKIGGSGTGISYYSTASRCSRRARLDKEYGSPSSEDSRTGTVGHALLDLFYTNKLTAALLDDPNLHIQVPEEFQEEVPEAIRLTKAYLKKFPERDFWGEVLGTEVGFPEGGQEDLIKAFFMVPLTARLDLVTRVDAAQSARIKERTGLDVPLGVIIVDHKFRTRRDSYVQDTYDLSAQFAAYPPLWDIHHPDEPCQGMVANSVIGNKEPAFQHCYVRPPDAVKLTGLRNWLIGAEALAGTDFPNWTSCKDFNRTCAHYSAGRCDRT